MYNILFLLCQVTNYMILDQGWIPFSSLVGDIEQQLHTSKSMSLDNLISTLTDTGNPQMAIETSPSNWLFPSISSFNSSRSAKVLGTVPVNALLDNLIWPEQQIKSTSCEWHQIITLWMKKTGEYLRSFVRVWSDSGMVPLRLFPSRFKTSGMGKNGIRYLWKGNFCEIIVHQLT